MGWGPGKTFAVSCCCRCVPFLVFMQTPFSLGLGMGAWRSRGVGSGTFLSSRFPICGNSAAQSPFSIIPDTRV